MLASFVCIARALLNCTMGLTACLRAEVTATHADVSGRVVASFEIVARFILNSPSGLCASIVSVAAVCRYIASRIKARSFVIT